MKHLIYIALWCVVCLLPVAARSNPGTRVLSIDFFGQPISLSLPALAQPTLPAGTPDAAAVQSFYQQMETAGMAAVAQQLQQVSHQQQLSDWFYYQLVRRTAQQLAPKAKNYCLYTLTKWYLMVASGYDATLAKYGDALLFYVHSNDEVSDVPYYDRNGRRYVCVNIHDYARINIQGAVVSGIEVTVPGAIRPFSYAITQMPDAAPKTYVQRQVAFSYGDDLYRFDLTINPQLQQALVNYPVVDFATYFNIPLSRQTHESLIPYLRQQIKGMKQRQGVDYLMHFTRHAFLYQTDQQHFGKEKRMGPEETLAYNQSDCDDRAALFYYLVKELYDLPMIVLQYPTHLTMAIQFSKPVGQTIAYQGGRYSICDPTPQRHNQPIGRPAPHLRHAPYSVVYAYQPR